MGCYHYEFILFPQTERIESTGIIKTAMMEGRSPLIDKVVSEFCLTGYGMVVRIDLTEPDKFGDVF